MIWQPYLTLLSKRPRAIKYSSLYDQFPALWTEYLNICTEEEQKSALRLLADLLKNDDFSLLNEALKSASINNHPSVDQIKHCFYTLLNEDTAHKAITPSMSVPKVPEAARGLSHYDSFFERRDQ